MHPYKRLFPYFRPHLWIVFLAVVFSLAMGIGHLGRVTAIIPAVHKILTRTDIVFAQNAKVPAFLVRLAAGVNSMSVLEAFYLLIIWIVVVEFIRGVFEFLSSFFLNKASENLMRDIRNRIYEKLLQLSLDFYGRSSTGKLVSKIIYDVVVLKNSVSQGLMDLVTEPVMFVVNLALIVCCKVFFSIPWTLIIAGVALFILIIYPVMAIGKRLRKIAKQSLEKMGDISMVLHETISGIRIVKAFSMEDYEASRFDRENRQFYKITMKSIKRMLVLSPLTEFISILSIVLVLWFVRHDLASGAFPFGAFGALMAALLSLMKPIKKLIRLYGIHQQAMASAAGIFDLMDTNVSVKEKAAAGSLAPFKREITFEDVSFGYEGKAIIRDINISIKKGEILAIVGPSGVGKTTLVNLIPRFYDVTDGAIKIDGTDVRDVTLKSLWGQIGLVTQETILFNDTVRANIAYGKADKATEEAIIAAAKIANAHDFITRLPQGYDTVVGEKGFRLSGGEKQRLAIARAVLKNPPILILDEATSQLDSESERLVQDALNRLMKGRTVFVIAHRLSTTKFADKILVLDKGTVVEEGVHEELVERGGLYKRLYDMQLRDT